MRNRAWFIEVPHHLNVMELYREELGYNIQLRYGILTLNLPTDYDVC